MDCFSSIFILSFQDFYTIVLDELVLEVAARHRDDVLAQPPDQDYNRGRRHNRTDSTFCGDMAIWEQETGVLYQVPVYGGEGGNIQTHMDSMLASCLEDSDR
jgi:hypothetical protein